MISKQFKDLTSTEVAELVTAHANGKTIEVAMNKSNPTWAEIAKPCWFDDCIYRIKPIHSKVKYLPWRELDKISKMDLLGHWVDGKEIEIFSTGIDEWKKIPNPMWDNDIIYRKKVIELTKPSINWDHVHPDYNYLTTDINGKSSLYSMEPLCWETYWFLDTCSEICTDSHISYVPGTCDWQDSLVTRPGYEPTE